MAPAAAKPGASPSKRSLEARLTRKLGPLPIWAWAAVILVAYLLYSRIAGARATPTPDTTAVTAGDGSGGSAQVPSSGQGSAADNLSQSMIDQLGANQSSIDALTQAVLSSGYGSGDGLGGSGYPGSYDMPLGGPPGAISQQGAAASPTTVAKAAAAAGGHAAAASSQPAHPTQTAQGKLVWGGVTFTSRSAFDNWAKQHGTTSTAIFKQHPAAHSLYGTLKP